MHHQSTSFLFPSSCVAAVLPPFLPFLGPCSASSHWGCFRLCCTHSPLLIMASLAPQHSPSFSEQLCCPALCPQSRVSFVVSPHVNLYLQELLYLCKRFSFFLYLRERENKSKQKGRRGTSRLCTKCGA